MSEYQERTSTANSLSLNTLFDLLSDHRRRAVLTQLTVHEHKQTVNDFAKEIAVQEQGEPITDVSGETLTQIHLSLHHTHIPKLAETPLVEYDEERKLVEPTEQLEELEPFLSTVGEADSVQSLCEKWQEKL